MLKRANKLTALVAAAATLASTVPAFAGTSRLETQDGEFTQAFSYAEGKFVYNGYRTDDDDTAIYFNDGENEDEVEDYDDYDFDNAVRYGTKYVTVEDGDDTYLLDLSTGKIDDDESLEDKIDNVQSKLKTNLKKADRYKGLKDAKGTDDEDPAIERILTNKYGEVWYKYTALGDTDADDYVTNGDYLTGVVNEDNKYLDLSYVANMYVYSADKAKTVKFENFGDSEDFTKDGKEATLKLVDTKIIDQDDDYLYAITTVKVEGDAVEDATTDVPAEDTVTDGAATLNAEDTVTITEDTTTGDTTTGDTTTGDTTTGDTTTGDTTTGDTTTGDTTTGDTTTGDTTTGDTTTGDTTTGDTTTGDTTTGDTTTPSAEDKKEDTTGYQYFFQKISKEQGDKKDGAYTPKSVTSYEININGTYKDDDANDAATELKKVLDQKEGSDVEVGDVINVEVKDNMIHVAELDKSDNVKVYQLKVKKDKLDTAEKTNVDAYVVLKDGDTDEDIIDTEDSKAYSVDADGNLWILGKGKIYKYNGDEFEQLYTCDRSINNLDVYDDENLIAWEADEDVFTALQAGKGSSKPGTEDPSETTDKVGWDKNEDGTWSFYDATGAQVKGSWVNVQGTWYYLKADGIMATGWLQEGGNWYYLNESGAMQTGWLNDNGTWYFLQPSGAMAYGWLQDTDGNWYYLSTTSGAMLTNTTIDGYVLGANGAWIR